MRLPIKFYGIENKETLSQDLIYLNAETPIEEVKKIFCEKIIADLTQNFKDLEGKIAKQKFDDEFITKVKNFLKEQYENFNIYVIKEIKEKSSELEIIPIENELKMKYLKNKEIEKYFKGDEK